MTCYIFVLSKKYVQDQPQYVESQLSRNRELEEILDKREGENVVLYEVLDEDVRKSRRRRRDSQGGEHTEVIACDSFIHLEILINGFIN